MSARVRILAVCSLLVLALFAVAAFAPLPFSIAQPGTTVDVLGADKGEPVISVSGTATRKTSGQLRMVTIQATAPDTTVRLGDVVENWFDEDRAVMPRDAVYPVGDSTEEIEKHNLDEMRESQDSATAAALNQLHLSADKVKVRLRLADIGGPSAGLLFSLGIINKIDGDGHGGDLTGGRRIAGTGTIGANGKIGAVGGVPLKTLAAKRDGATVFLVPKDECDDAKANRPEGLQLIPVTTLKNALQSLRALREGGSVPRC